MQVNGLVQVLVAQDVGNFQKVLVAQGPRTRPEVKIAVWLFCARLLHAHKTPAQDRTRPPHKTPAQDLRTRPVQGLGGTRPGLRHQGFVFSTTLYIMYDIILYVSGQLRTLI